MICILDVLETYLETHHHQFGFRSTLNIPNIKHYTDQNTPVYQCLLDASKAFDWVNHWTLFAKLIDTRAPLLIVRM